MPVQEIPSYQWPSFYQHFAHQHRGTAVRVETARFGVAPHLEMQDLKLQDLSLEINTDGSSAVHIRAEHSNNARWTDFIFQATQTRLDCTETGEDLGLTFEAANGTQMRLHLQSAPARQASRDFGPHFRTWSSYATQT